MKILYYLFLSIFCFSFAQTKSTFIYAEKEGEKLVLDVYQPENITDSIKLPAIIWMHGGGFSGGSKDNKEEIEFYQEAVKQGYIVVAISYRLTRKESGFGCNVSSKLKMETFKLAAEDFLDASSFIFQRTEELHIDREKIIAGGSSAGAESILNSIFMRDEWFSGKYQNIQFAALISFAGALVSLENIHESHLIPAVFFHGEKDDTVPFAIGSHRRCKKEDPGYIKLFGSNSIVNEYKKYPEKSFFFYISKKGKHEWSWFPFKETDSIFWFLNQVLLKKRIVSSQIIGE